ncbi:unnamed protein product [Rhodiola kirilowii]
MKCPYCAAAQGRCATTTSGKSITECTSCGRVIEERQSQPHHFFHLRAQDNPLCLVTPDLPPLPRQTLDSNNDEDPFEPTGSSPPSPPGRSSIIRSLLNRRSPSPVTSRSWSACWSLLRQRVRVRARVRLLFRDCCSATCLRNRSVEALATAALVQAIREAQEPRTLQEISIAANVPQKEIGKYIKILGEALQLSQPINSNSISVHMPRFCTLLQLNKSAQELATHIGEVVINKCFCTRRNPISISAAAIYLACQLEDKRKTQAEICKITGLTEVTLRKVYKELLENWDDLLPSNYTPAVPPEKAFPTTAISSGRSTTPRSDIADLLSPTMDRKQLDIPLNKLNEVISIEKTKDDGESKANSGRSNKFVLNQAPRFWQKQHPPGVREFDTKDSQSIHQDTDQKIDKDSDSSTNSPNSNQLLSPASWPFKHLSSMPPPPPPPPHSSRQESAGKETRIPPSNTSSISWSFRPQTSSTPAQLNSTPSRASQGMPGYAESRGTAIQSGSKIYEHGSADK